MIILLISNYYYILTYVYNDIPKLISETGKCLISTNIENIN